VTVVDVELVVDDGMVVEVVDVDVVGSGATGGGGDWR
jgi:hypothetical protein